ncbi:MAG: protein kinase [Deltaproteobacteria bacterium]|nr:protein kinase [Deltaproteobacteria bacterium]
MQVGDIVDGRYRLLDVLGEGAAGKVFRCEDIGRGNMFVALKMLHAKDPRWENFFRKEFEILSRLHHPNLVRVFDFGPAPDDGSWYFTQELVVGKPLLDSLAGKKIDEVLALFVEICRALEFIHGHGVLHRDLKPANILVQSHADPGERVRVLDFGLWRELDPTPQRGARWAGTPPYLASEVLRGFGHSICADLYAVGVTLFQVVTRKLPHGRGTPQELLAARKTPAPSLQALGYGSRALSDLLMRLLDEEPSRRPQSAAEVASALSQLIPNQTIAMPIALGRARLVGRDNEQKRITDLVEMVKDRKPEAPRLVIVEGKDGVGKSRFVAEVKAISQLAGGRAAIGTCLEDGRWAYRPIAELVRSLAPLARRAQLSEGERLVIDRLCPELAEQRGEDDRAQRSPAERQRFQLSAAQLFIGMSTPGQAVVLIVEDVGFCDAASIAVFVQIIKAAKAAGVVVVATADDALGPVPRELLDAAGKDMVRLPLEGLKRDDVRKLVAALLGIPLAETVPEPFAELLLSHSGGNPLLVEEVLALMIQRGDLKRGEQGWLLDEYRSAVVNTPTTLVVEQRIQRLSDAEKRTLRALAVFNRPSGPKLLAAVARVDVDQVRRALATAEAQGLIRVVDTEDGRPRVVFRHPNIREALIKSLKEDGSLASWHEVCAAVLEERAKGNLAPVAETLAVHLERAGDVVRAVRFFVMAVDHALSQFAFEDALATARRAARLVSAGRGIDKDDVVRADLAVAKALFLCGQIPECRAFLESALEREGAASTTSFAELHLWMSRACLKLGATDSGLRHVERALAATGAGSAVPAAGNNVTTARLLVARAELLQTVQPKAAEKDADRALALFGKKPALDDELAALAAKGAAAFGMGRFKDAAAVARRRADLCQKAARRLDEIPALRALAEAIAADGDRLGAREHLNQALKLARQAGHRVEEALLLKSLGDQLFISGAHSEAISRFQSAATLAAETGQTLARAEALKNIGKSYLAKGDYDRAVDHLKAAVDAFDRAGSDDDAVCARASLMHALLTKNALPEAEEVLTAAAARLKKAARPRALGELAQAQGQLFMQKGDFTASREAFTRAVVAFRAAGDRFALGDTLVGLGQLLLRSQAPKRALRLARRAEWIFTDLDARGQLKRIQPLLNATQGLAGKS